MTIHTQPAAIDSIKKSLVALKMPRALEMLDTALRRVEQGEITWIEALDQLLIEELTLRDNRRVSTALRMSRLTTVKTLAGFDFAFQPSLDRHRILALAELKFIDRAEMVHLLGRFLAARKRRVRANADRRDHRPLPRRIRRLRLRRSRATGVPRRWSV